MDWLAALLVWLAVGARVGRVIVRSATTVRISIVFAVCFLAAAQTVGIDDVARTIDRRWDAAAVIAMCWAGFSAASAVIATHAWPNLRPRPRRTTTAVISAVTVASIAGSAFTPIVGWIFVVAALLFVVITGVRVCDWTPLGGAVGLYSLGACAPAAVAITVLFGAQPNRILLTVGALTISLGAVWVLLGTWIRARILLYRIKNLHRTLTGRFPEVVDRSRSRAPTVLRASDHVSETMDALYLQVGAGQLDDDTEPPENPVERAARLAHMVRDPLADPVLGTHWIASPPHMSLAQWVTLIATTKPEEPRLHAPEHDREQLDTEIGLRRTVRRHRR